MIYWFISAPWAKWSPRLSPSPSVYYFVCFAPFTEEDGGRAVDSHDRWQSVCVCMLLCLFSTPLFLRGVSARHNQYSGIVLPPHLIQWDPQVWVVRCLIGQSRQGSFSCIRTTRAVSVKYLKNASSYRHISIVYGVYVYEMKQWNSKTVGTGIRWQQYGSPLSFQSLDRV